ncbi:Transcriptional regulator, AraC family [Lunatimonas lonarensis]|uniref:Transcriptional regulator, AraC family n=2 Tax=Lunatimonas lonarensis TaxID=1232681 RepID=R7ZWK7_9BACT|nr:Transcriptional regulator, AraC family [Lunatimonas lonarensis]
MSYIAFPHTNTCISLFQGVEILRDNLTLTIKSDETVKDQVSVEITGKYTQPFFVNYQGLFKEIAIIFKPLGVNYFLKNDLIEYAPLFSQPLALSHWHSIAEELFMEENLSKRIELLEAFLLENLTDKDDTIVRKAMLLIEDFEKDYTMQEVAEHCALTIKTLQRNFKRLLTCTPSEYKRIAKFRYSLYKEGLQKEIKKLTEIAYESNYYDQSYFIRDFKKLTGINPKAFFQRVSKLEENKIIWEIR